MSVETLNPTVNTVWRLDVDTDTTGTAPTWTQVRAMNSFAPNVNNTVQDSTDYDSQGWGSDAITLRKWQNVLVLMRKQDAAKAYDPGQEALRSAADSADLVHVRWYDRSTPTGESYEGHAIVQWEPQGGTADGLQTVNVTLLGQGERKTATHPDAGP